MVWAAAHDQSTGSRETSLIGHSREPKWDVSQGTTHGLPEWFIRSGAQMSSVMGVIATRGIRESLDKRTAEKSLVKSHVSALSLYLNYLEKKADVLSRGEIL